MQGQGPAECPEGPPVANTCSRMMTKAEALCTVAKKAALPLELLTTVATTRERWKYMSEPEKEGERSAGGKSAGVHQCREGALEARERSCRE